MMLDSDLDLHPYASGSVLCLLILVATALSSSAPVVGWLAAGLIATVLVAAACATLRLPALAVFVLAFPLVSQHAGEGVPLVDAAYAAAFFTFVGFCLARVVVDTNRADPPDAADLAIGLLLGCVVVGLVTTVVLDGEKISALKEATAFSFLFAYVPARYLDYSKPSHVRAMVIAMTITTLVLAVINFREYYVGYTEADVIWQIAVNRVTTNEHWFMMLGPAYLLLYALSSGFWHRLVGVFMFAICGTAVIIGQSRAVWVAFGIAIIITVILLQGVPRRRAIVLLATMFALALLTMAVLFREVLQLVVIGLAYRFSTISTAAEADLSLINRFQESRAVLAAIVRTPVVGNGFGVPYSYYSLVYESTHRTSFVHNTFLAVAYHFGLIGLGLLVTFVARIGQLAIRAARSAVWRRDRAIGIAVICAIVAELVSGVTEYTFGTAERPLLIGILAGTVVSLARRRHDDLHA